MAKERHLVYVIPLKIETSPPSYDGYVAVQLIVQRNHPWVSPQQKANYIRL